jgi:hypothetical protein
MKISKKEYSDRSIQYFDLEEFQENKLCMLNLILSIYGLKNLQTFYDNFIPCIFYWGKLQLYKYVTIVNPV